MNDRHEQSRAAFEEAHRNFTHARDGVEYKNPFENARWDAWRMALDYAAEQQAAPTMKEGGK